ncbi:hypothetical protein [Janthinobacterium sp. 17J80-10]|uniref:hypothetical protein n=1 Tax=Janthinobacterium sp. 17J80-10 TaxID=2497863 RepID=UPI0013E8A984|nr:hypothetical protein [Janthinobacterium sp. 17J80-10]
MNNSRFIVYALLVAFFSVVASWGEMLSSNRGGGNSRSGSSWSSNSGGGSWGSGGHK